MSYPDFDRVALDEVSRAYGRRRALSRVSLVCRAGEITGLLGPNGAGKTTLLGVMASLVGASSGTVRYGAGTPPLTGALLRANIGWLGHELGLYPELTGRENLEFFARLHGIDGREVIARALDRANLSDRAGDVVGIYSRGMRQRLALERVLLHSPRLVLLDEPFTGLDHQAVALLARRLHELQSDGRIVVFATHDLDAAEQVCDRVAILRSGRVLSVERVQEHLRERYAERLSSGRAVEAHG